MRHRETLPLISLLIVSFALAGCAKKKAPVTAPGAVAAAPSPATAVEAAPRAHDVADPIEKPLDGDLAEATRYAHESGLLGDVYFDFDQATLRAEARERLAKNAEFLRSRPEFAVLIEGHCDERGTNEYNLALGERRAQSARDYLTSLGIPAARLRTISFGEERPVCSASDESCWQLNRRAGFVLVGRIGVG